MLDVFSSASSLLPGLNTKINLMVYNGKVAKLNFLWPVFLYLM